MLQKFTVKKYHRRTQYRYLTIKLKTTPLEEKATNYILKTTKDGERFSSRLAAGKENVHTCRSKHAVLLLSITEGDKSKTFSSIFEILEMLLITLVLTFWGASFHHIEGALTINQATVVLSLHTTMRVPFTLRRIRMSIIFWITPWLSGSYLPRPGAFELLNLIELILKMHKGSSASPIPPWWLMYRPYHILVPQFEPYLPHSLQTAWFLPVLVDCPFDP